MAIIKISRSVIPACDVAELEKFEEIVEETAQIEKIGAYKIGFELGLQYGWGKVVKTARKHSDKPIIYDHQKAGTDIPDTGKNFASVCKKAKLDAAILFPQAGPETEKAWITALKEAGIAVIVGGEMTHKGYLENESGYIMDEAPKRMYENAVISGVNDFVVPGNKPEKISFYRSFLESKGAEPVLYSPGLIAQGGKISDSAKVAGKHWHAIVGRALYEAPNIRKAALEMVKEI